MDAHTALADRYPRALDKDLSACQGRWNNLCRTCVPFLPLVIALVAYAKILPTFFVQDDFWLLRDTLRPFPNRFMLTGGLSEYLRPVTTYWFPLLNRYIWGLDPCGFHLSQMACTLLTIYALYRIIFRLTQSSMAGLVTAIIYGLSKVHLYTLCWIAGGIDNAAGCFLALTLLAIVRYEQGQGSLWPIGIACTLGLLSKESTIVLVIAWAGAVVIRSLLAKALPEAVGSRAAPTDGASGQAATESRGWMSVTELRTGLLLAGIVAVYAVLRMSLLSTHAEWGFDLDRFKYIIKSSIMATLPIPELSMPIGKVFLLLPLSVAAGALLLRPLGKAHEAVLCLLLWVLHAAIFAISIKLPPGLQLYYAHFNVIGLALLSGICCAGVLEHFRRRGAMLPVQMAIGLLLGTYTCCSAAVVRQGIANASSPAMLEARYSRSAYNQLSGFLADRPYRSVVLLATSEAMWWSMGKGDMFLSMFPGLDARFDGRDNYQAEPNIRSDDKILVVRQTSEFGFEVVR
jgi:hypothetical protein